MTPAAPGRSCPLHYHYGPAVMAAAPAVHSELLYVVGGLYGNAPALQRVLDFFAQEAEPKRLVFNGDFNWFNIEPVLFETVNRQVLEHDALRGNVETELAGDDEEAGCGCAYPAWVGDGVVQRSNRILQRLRETARSQPALTQRLAALPMWARYDVGPLRLGVVHGDAQSLAGWGFAQEHLQQAEHRATALAWLDAARVDAFACSHTCLPVFRGLPRSGGAPPAWVLNNGATGMPNFRGERAGLFTRIGLRPFAGPTAARRHGLVQQGVHIDAIAIDAATPEWQSTFLRQWPVGSDAHASYWQRMQAGPDFGPEHALVLP